MKDEAKRFGLRSVKVDFGMFNTELACVFGPPAGVQDYVRWQCSDPGLEINDMTRVRGHFFFQPQGKGPPIIYMPRVPRTPRDLGTLAHECLHAVTHVMDYYGVPPCNVDADEVYAHAIGHLMTKILEGLRK